MKGFQEPQIVHGDWIRVDGPMGTDYLAITLVKGRADMFFEGETRPVHEAIAPYTENREAYSVRRVTGYGARLSAPGFLDCTPWSVCDTEEEARQYLYDTYDICPDCGDDEECDCEWIKKKEG